MDKFLNDSLHEKLSLKLEQKSEDKFKRLLGEDPVLDAVNQKIQDIEISQTIADIENVRKTLDLTQKGILTPKDSALDRMLENIFFIQKSEKYEKEKKELEAFKNFKEDYKKDIFSNAILNPYEESLNRDKSTYLADYSLSAKWKDMGLRLAAGIPQGLGLVGDYAAIYIKRN